MNNKFFARTRKKSSKTTTLPPDSEANEQQIVVRYLKEHYPTALFCASAGGMFTSPRQAIKMKLTGYVKGFPDLFIYEPNETYKGLAIEMKRTKGGVVSSEQKEWIKGLNERGYYAVICKGSEQAIQVIKEYLKC